VSSRATTKREIDALQNNVDGFNQANLTVSLTRIKTRAMAKRLEVQQEEIRRIHEVHHAIASVDKVRRHTPGMDTPETHTPETHPKA
jgi:hypothetical protein